MNLFARLNARLVGFRMVLLAVLFAVPDILTALVGFDWSAVLPAGYEGLGVKIGAGLGLFRLVSIPVLKSIRDAARDGAREGGRNADGGPR